MKKPGEGRKWKSSGGEPEFDTARTSALKKKRASGEKADKKDSKSFRFPLNRVRIIVRSDNSNIKITRESYFLICKATECFIEQFCNEAFSLAASHGLKKLLKYDHLALLVYNMNRYDFLSDYVPRKIKAKDALAETKLQKIDKLKHDPSPSYIQDVKRLLLECCSVLGSNIIVV